MGAQVRTEEIEINSTPILSKGTCLGDNNCLNDTFCDIQAIDKLKMQNIKDFCSGKQICDLTDAPVISYFVVPPCVPKFGIGKECYKNEQCLSNNCGTGQGGEKKCMDPISNEGYLKFTPTAPKLEVDIPTLQPFTTKGMEKPDAEGNIYIPFIGQYIVGIYKWALLVAGIIATVMIILGGFTYLTSGGDASRAGEGKERITSAIFGLILLLGSYMLLYLLNPDLVQFKSLKINVIENIPLEDALHNTDLPPGTNIPDFSMTDASLEGLKEKSQYNCSSQDIAEVAAAYAKQGICLRPKTCTTTVSYLLNRAGCKTKSGQEFIGTGSSGKIGELVKGQLGWVEMDISNIELSKLTQLPVGVIWKPPHHAALHIGCGKTVESSYGMTPLKNWLPKNIWNQIKSNVKLDKTNIYSLKQLDVASLIPNGICPISAELSKGTTLCNYCELIPELGPSKGPSGQEGLINHYLFQNDVKRLDQFEILYYDPNQPKPDCK